MNADPTGPGFLDELKRRKVIRVAIVYVVGAVATVEAADLFFPRIGLADWTVTLVVGLAIVGFPLALSLAWAFQWTPAGLEREVVGVQSDPWGAGPSPETGSQTEPPGPVGDRRSVAVLPFSNLSADPEHAYFADGVTEDVLAHLGKVKALQVTSRTSVLRYRGATKPVRQIAGELGVGTVLEGTVRVGGGRVRVVAQLIDAESDTHLWAETYDRELDDIFAVQSDVAESVARALEAELSGEELAGIRSSPTDDVQAYALFLKGMAAFETGTPEDYAHGLDHLEAALRIDPDYARAHAGLALLLAAYPSLTSRLPRSYHDRLRRAADRALELDPASGHAWVARGYYLWSRERDWLAADEAVGRALELEPDDLHILLLAAEHHRMLGRLDEATGLLDHLNGLGQDPPYAEVLRAGIEMLRAQAGELDPRVPVRRLEALITREPTHAVAHLWRAMALYDEDRLEEVTEGVETSLRLSPDLPLAHGYRGTILARRGSTAGAEEELKWFRRQDDAGPVDRFSWAMVHFGLNDVDRAFDLLEEGVRDTPSFLIPGFRLMEYYRPFWEHPRGRVVLESLWAGAQKQVLGPYGWQP